MPKTNEVVDLIRSIGDRNFERARQTILVMVANERGNHRDDAARRLESALQNWGDNNAKLIELPQNLKGLLWTQTTLKELDEIYLSGTTKHAVARFINERNAADKLKMAGLSPRNRILLAGPPGNGKTTLAGAIGKELNIPFYAVKLSDVIGSYMGSSGKNINSIFEHAFTNRCVIFIDELDALGHARTSASGGPAREYNLILNNLLTNLDRLPDTSVVIGATNMPDILDNALLRRFNLKLWLDIPGKEDIQKYVVDYQIKHDVNFWLSETDILTALNQQPWSKVEEFCMEWHRSIVMNGYGEMSTQATWIGRDQAEYEPAGEANAG